MKLPSHILSYAYNGPSEDPLFEPIRRGNSYLKNGDHASAIQQFTTAIDRNPRCAGAYNNRAAARWALGDHDGAIQDFSKALQFESGNILALFNRGVVWADMGDLAKAVSDLSGVVVLSPEEGHVFAYRGYLLNQQGDFAAAIDDYERAIQLDPGDADSRNNLAWIWSTCPIEEYRNGAKAVEYALQACELTKYLTWYCIGTLGAAHAEAGDWKNAILRQQQAIDMISDQKEKQVGCERIELYKVQKPYREDL